MWTTQGCYLLFWTNLGNTTRQNSNYTATYLSSLKPSKYDEQYFQRCKDVLISDILLWTPIHGHTSVGRLVKTYIHHELLSRRLARRDGQLGRMLKESRRNPCLTSWLSWRNRFFASFWKRGIYIYIYIYILQKALTYH